MVEWTQAVQLELQHLAGDLFILFWRSLGGTWQWLSLPCVYIASRAEAAHEECSSWSCGDSGQNLCYHT